MNIQYVIQHYKREIYELQLRYQTYFIDSNNPNELIVLIQNILYNKAQLNHIYRVL